jgi:hypothetical protein
MKRRKNMHPCDELKNIVLHHYGQFDSGEQSVSIENIYSLQQGVVIIGNDPNEWFDDRDAIVAFMQAAAPARWTSLFRLSEHIPKEQSVGP